MPNKTIHLVLIHGFAAHKNIWGQLAQELAQTYTVHTVDLPGYGNQTHVNAHDLNDVAHCICAHVQQPVIWVGWSLGGLIARYLAQTQPQLTRGVITLASNPNFIASEDWPCGVRYGAFHNLKKAFIRESKIALKHFMSLQNKGMSAEQIKQLLILQQQAPVPSTETLLRDLHLLATIDMRTTISQLTCPQLNILGTQDRVVPVELAKHLKVLSPTAQNVTIENAGHVMFLSHMPECLTAINRFINESIIVP